MREPRIQMPIGKAAVPMAAIGFLGGKSGAVAGGIPMVELMHGHRLPCAEEHAVRLRGERGIAKAHQPPHAEPLPRQHTRHGVGGSGVIFQRLAQVQKAAAFRHGGQAALHGGVYGAAHGGVGRQLGGVQLRVAARRYVAAARHPAAG